MSENDRLEDDANQRLEQCRWQKTQFDLDLREGYFFAAPHRARTVSSRFKATTTKPKDAEILNTSLGFELAGDFSTMILNTFLPEAEPWATRRAGMLVPDQEKAQLEQQAAAGDDKIFKAIAGSNFYAECGKGFTPDLALGVVGMWCDQPKSYEPLRFQSVPIRELEINCGPTGEIDDRFIVRHTKYRHLPAILKGVEFPAEIRALINDKGHDDCEAAWGFWRLHDRDEETWQYVTLVDGKLVGKPQELKGPGSCPLIVGRFNPSAEWAYAVGPLIQALPDLRVIDDLAIKKMKMIGRQLDPPIAVPDDSMANFEEGIEDGAIYAVRPGSEDALKSIYKPESPDPAIYFTQDLESRIKRLFFLDFPNQPGKTPPTATQWLDEMTMAQRRIGTPGLSFWNEFCRGTFLRVQFILEKQGVIQPLQVNGKNVTLMPYNPAQQAYEQQLIAQFARFAQIAAGLFPEEWKVTTDGQATMANLARTMAVTKVWAQRKPEDVKAAIQHIQALAQANAPQAPNVPAGQPIPQPDTGAGAPAPQYKIGTRAA